MLDVLVCTITVYYMEKSVLLGTKPLVDSIRHFIQDPSGVFSVCHLCECRIVQWPHDSRLLLLLNWFLHIIKRTLHVGSKIWILCIDIVVILFLPLEHKIHIFSPPCNILYIFLRVVSYFDQPIGQVKIQTTSKNITPKHLISGLLSNCCT